MLKELKLENFRCFSDFIIPFKHTSVVIGRNNAGKSTIVEALRLVAIVATRYRSLSIVAPQEGRNIPRTEKGVAPSVKGLEINFRSIFYGYGDPPAIITALFNNDTSIKIYIKKNEKIHAVIYNSQGKIVKTRSEIKEVDIPLIEIMPQVAPLASEETVLTNEYVKSALSQKKSPSHFRNQLKVLNNFFDGFKEISESTWPGLQIRELICDRGYPGDPIQLMVRDDEFVAEVGDMGHGLQMWLQAMWFLARTVGASTVILDEPDVFMHPDLQRRLIRFLKNRYPQVIIMTHSVEIMSEVDVDEILIIDRKKPRSRFAGTLPAVQRLIEHIGSVHNIHLAKLWHSRRCIFVEGKDMKLLNEIHNIIYPENPESLTSYPNMSIGGWGGWKYAVGSSMLLKNAGGQTIEVYCILDSDYHSKEELEARMVDANKNNVHLHIWNYKEIENYCLDPVFIQRAIQSRLSTRKKLPEENEIKIILEEILEDLKNVVFDAFSSEILARDRTLGAGGANKEARVQLDSDWKTFNGKIRVAPGKEVISRLSRWSQDKFNVSLSASLIARQMNQDEVPEEIVEVLKAIENLTEFPILY